MIFPFESLSDERHALGLGVAVLIGIGFGFVLERSGFGRAQKLVGQFYGTDMTVLKVMFTAIVTAMLGMVILWGAGLFDMESAQFNYPTYLWPMVLGGVLLGVGFITSGYCPGTSVVAASSGKLDGLATVGGVIFGGLLYAEVEPALGSFPNSGRLGTLTLPKLLGLPPPVVAAAVVAIAIGAFIGAEKIERLVTGAQAAAEPMPVRRRVFVALGVLAVVALVTLALPKPEPEF